MVPRGTARKLRRQAERAGKAWAEVPRATREHFLLHELDDDACCIHCGFDGAEEYHLRVSTVHPHARMPAPFWAVYCERRTERARKWSD